jgi:hypothetical protein
MRITLEIVSTFILIALLGCSMFRVETVQNLGVLTPCAGTDGGPTARRQRDPAQASRWRSRSEPCAFILRCNSHCTVLSVTAVEIGSSSCRAVA